MQSGTSGDIINVNLTQTLADGTIVPYAPAGYTDGYVVVTPPASLGFRPTTLHTSIAPTGLTVVGALASFKTVLTMFPNSPSAYYPVMQCFFAFANGDLQKSDVIRLTVLPSLH